MRRPKEDDVELDGPTGMELRASPQPYVQLSFQLPTFYVRVLDGEAELLSQRRSTLLEFLVLRKTGDIIFERSPRAPKYRVEPRELHEVQRYVWHCRLDIKERLDRLRERMGNIPPRSWVVLALNEWIGMPAGVGDLEPHEAEGVDEAPTEVRARSKRTPPLPPPARRKPHFIRRPAK